MDQTEILWETRLMVRNHARLEAKESKSSDYSIVHTGIVGELWDETLAAIFQMKRDLINRAKQKKSDVKHRAIILAQNEQLLTDYVLRCLLGKTDVTFNRQYASRKKLYIICRTMGELVVNEYRLNWVLANRGGDAQKVIEFSKIAGLKPMQRSRLKRHVLELYEDEYDLSDVNDIYQIGGIVIEAVLSALEDYFVVVQSKSNTAHYIVPTEELFTLYEKHKGNLVESVNVIQPTIREPMPFTSEGKGFKGGYYVFPRQLVRTKMCRPSTTTVKAANVIQNTPWAVNQFILETAREALEEDVKLPDFHGKPPTVPHFEDTPGWDKLSRTEKGKIKMGRKQAWDVFHSNYSKYTEQFDTLNEAYTMTDQERFFFVSSLDFRTRVYPVTSYLSPQGADFSKSLLRFADGVPMGDVGMYWLCVSLANHWGNDKIPFMDRMKWAIDHTDEIAMSAAAPLKYHWWTKADKPWQFLAACHEFLHAQDNPDKFLTHLPVAQDGSCNGMQILSILGRDRAGAVATNCSSEPAIHDLYQDVADRIYAKACQDKTPEGQEWMAKLRDKGARRKYVKRSVMTVPYGVTKIGMRDHIIGDHDLTDMWDVNEASVWLANEIMEALDETMTSGRQLQGYFADVAGLCAAEGKPFQWRSPVGSVCGKHYGAATTTRINTMMGRFTYWDANKPAGEPDAKKMRQASSPNVIHSCDASVLQEVALRLHNDGIRSMAMVHDSFGVHAPNVGCLRSHLKQTMYDMFKYDYLEMFRDSVYELNEVETPEPPKSGDFDISEVLEAEYMFG